MVLDNSSNLYVTGGFSGSVDFDPGAGASVITSSGLFGAFVMKMTSGGAFQWVQGMVGTGEAAGFRIDLGPSGRTHTIGALYGTIDFDPGPGTAELTAVANRDIFILKLDDTIAPPPPPDWVWVDFAFGGSSSGTFEAPYKTLAAGISNVVTDGTVYIKGDTAQSTSGESLVISKPVRIQAINGTVRIGI